MLTRWHNTFHILVFGSLGILVLIVLVVKREYRVEQQPAGGENEKSISVGAGASGAELAENGAQGGPTPEETFVMFLEALKSGDTELASRYFVIPRRQGWEESLRQIKAGGGLAAMHEELSKIPSLWEKKNISSDEVLYVYRAQNITFVKNIVTHMWEIRDL
ncbi:MAG: hypothetical protein Q7S09_04135 [bacterium]|nr:hypothetical protein [bacterium]